MQHSGLYPRISQVISGDGKPFQIVDNDKALSDSVLWPLLENFYRHQKINAWDDMPSYATNNRLIAEVYADLIISVLRDSLPLLNPNAPLYIVELAAGSGCFAAHFLEAFYSKITYFKALSDLNIQYVLSDFSDMNFHAWSNQPRFRPFLESGKLHFSVFRPENDELIQLAGSDVMLNKSTLKNPLVVLGNYFFDSIRHDLFMVKAKTLYEVRLSFFRELSETLSESDPLSMSHLRYFENAVPIELPYYKEAAFNALLQNYQEQLNDTPFIFPIGALTCIHNLQKIAGGQLIILSSDKGVTQLSEVGTQLNYDVHGEGFSFFVNFHAIRDYIANQGGQSLQTQDSRLITNLNILLPENASSLEQTRYYFEENLVKQNVVLNHCYAMYLTVDKIDPGNQLRAFVAHLEESRYEPMALFLSGPRLIPTIPQLSERHKQELIRVLNRVRSNLFLLYSLPDLWSVLGAFYYHCGRPGECLDMMDISTVLYGDNEVNLYYRAVAQEADGLRDVALSTFQDLLRFQPDCPQVYAGIERLKNSDAQAKEPLSPQMDLTYFKKIMHSNTGKKST